MRHNRYDPYNCQCRRCKDGRIHQAMEDLEYAGDSMKRALQPRGCLVVPLLIVGGAAVLAPIIRHSI